MRIKPILLICIAFFIVQEVSSQCTNCGVIVYKHRRFDSALNKYVATHMGETKLYYKDSMAIVPLIATHSDSKNGITKYWEEDVTYTFIDMRAKPPFAKPPPFSKDSTLTPIVDNITFYRYPAFSKDSFFIKKYNNLDTALNSISYNFYVDFKISDTTYPEGTIKEYGEPMADTVMDGVLYKRVKMLFTVNKPGKYLKSVGITYSRCDRDNWMFHKVMGFDAKTGCSCTRVEWLIIGKQNWLTQETEFLPRTLTPEEIAVFDAWQKNADEHPVE